MFLSVFSCGIIEVNHFIQIIILSYSISSALKTLPVPMPYEYEITLAHVCILLSSLTLSAILLAFFVNALLAFLPIFCCDYFPSFVILKFNSPLVDIAVIGLIIIHLWSQRHKFFHYSSTQSILRWSNYFFVFPMGSGLSTS